MALITLSDGSAYDISKLNSKVLSTGKVFDSLYATIVFNIKQYLDFLNQKDVTDDVPVKIDRRIEYIDINLNTGDPSWLDSAIDKRTTQTTENGKLVRTYILLAQHSSNKDRYLKEPHDSKLGEHAIEQKVNFSIFVKLPKNEVVADASLIQQTTLVPISYESELITEAAIVSDLVTHSLLSLESSELSYGKCRLSFTKKDVQQASSKLSAFYSPTARGDATDFLRVVYDITVNFDLYYS